jgi:hypothetical protein
VPTPAGGNTTDVELTDSTTVEADDVIVAAGCRGRQGCTRTPDCRVPANHAAHFAH